MSRSRFGGFRKGWRRYKNKWAVMSTPTSAPAPPEVASELDYSATKGIWDLTATNQFPKQPQSAVPPGLSSVLFSVSGPNDAWTQHAVNISAYANATVRLVFHATNGGGYDSDFQVDAVDLDGNVYSFENQTHGFETSVGSSADFSGVTWQPLAVEQGNTARWQVDTGGTPSPNTGRGDAAAGTYYVYSEASSPADQAGYNFWLRSPQIVLGGSPTLTFFEARFGGSIGTLEVHLEVIA